MNHERVLELEGKKMDVISFRELVEELTGVPFEEIYSEEVIKKIDGENNAKSNMG